MLPRAKRYIFLLSLLLLGVVQAGCRDKGRTCSECIAEDVECEWCEGSDTNTGTHTGLPVYRPLHVYRYVSVKKMKILLSQADVSIAAQKH